MSKKEMEESKEEKKKLQRLRELIGIVASKFFKKKPDYPHGFEKGGSDSSNPRADEQERQNIERVKKHEHHN